MFGKLWMDGARVMMLGFEAQGVIAQRMMMFGAGGPKAQAEMQRMVSEKILAASQAGLQIASGASSAKIVQGYRRKVRANSKRLAKG